MMKIDDETNMNLCVNPTHATLHYHHTHNIVLQIYLISEEMNKQLANFRIYSK